MAIVIDPEIRILPDDHRIFILHPGDGKRFYADFFDTNSVFLDIPGITLPAVIDIDDEDFRNGLRMAKRISLWHRGSKKDDEPSRNPSDYQVKNPAVQAPRFVHEIHDLYTEARPGDLIVIPGKGYNSTVYIGEFEGVFDPSHHVVSRRYPDEQIPARKVKWLDVSMAKGQFSRRLIRLMQNRQAIIQVSKDEDKRDIYEFAYGEYIWKETSGSLIRVTEDVIDVKDLTEAFDLTNYFASQYIALRKGELDKFLELSFHDAIEKYYDKKYFGGVSVEIHSPGYFGRPMKDVMLAGYVSAMLAISGSGVSAQEAIAVTVENSANATRSVCDERLEADIRESMEMHANFDLWEKVVCPRREATKKEVGLKTGVSVKVNRNGQKP
ncbi:MAG TPA: hypothetical protein VGC14_12740 [Rhizobium sp.]